jgi:RimJ/RimL family protein N-acetyltransferase
VQRRSFGKQNSLENQMDITTTRLHIRDLIENDAEPMNRLRTNPAVYRFNHFGPETLEGTLHWIIATKFYNERSERDSHNCAIVLRSNGEVIGWIGFGFSHPEGKPIGNVGIGYAIRPEFWNQGFTTEGLRATLDVIFRETTAENAEANCYVGNIGSARVMEKAGMQRVARYANPDESSPDKAESYKYLLSREMWNKDHPCTSTP